MVHIEFFEDINDLSKMICHDYWEINSEFKFVDVKSIREKYSISPVELAKTIKESCRLIVSCSKCENPIGTYSSRSEILLYPFRFTKSFLCDKCAKKFETDPAKKTEILRQMENAVRSDNWKKIDIQSLYVLILIVSCNSKKEISKKIFDDHFEDDYIWSFIDNLEEKYLLWRERDGRGSIKKYHIDENLRKKILQEYLPILSDKNWNINRIHEKEKLKEIIDLCEKKHIDSEVKNYGNESSNLRHRETILTGIFSLDRLLKGLNDYKLIGLFAYDSNKLTSLLTTIAKRQAIDFQGTVRYFSTFFSTNEINRYLITSDLNIDYERIETRNFKNNEKELALSEIQLINRSGLILESKEYMLIDDFAKKFIRDSQIVIIDNLHFLSLNIVQSNIHNTPEKRLNFILSELFKISKNNKVPIIIGIPTEKIYDKDGIIEGICDLIIRLQYPKRNVSIFENDFSPNCYKLVITKNRFGPKDEIPLEYNQNYRRFYEFDYE